MKIKLLVFDTETNDQAKNYKLSARDDLNNYPFILQLAARLIEVNIDEDLYLNNNTRDRCLTYKDIVTFNSLVRPTRGEWDEPIEISQDAFEVHGITIEKCFEEGNYIQDVVAMTQGMIMFADVIICHNVNFDKNVLLSEALRLNLDLRFKNGSIVWCSMLNTVETCKISSEGKAKFFSPFKWPKLEELFKFLYNVDMTSIHKAHDAMGDVNATVDCVLELLRRDINLFNKNIT